MQSKVSVGISGRLHHAVVVNELKVIEVSGRQGVVELVHDIPRSIAHANHNNRQGITARFDNRLFRLSLISNLTIGNDNENMILTASKEKGNSRLAAYLSRRAYLAGLLHDSNRFFDQRSEISRAGHAHFGSDLVVGVEYSAKARAIRAIWLLSETKKRRQSENVD